MHSSSYRWFVGAVATVALVVTGCASDDGESPDQVTEASTDEGEATSDDDSADGSDSEPAATDEEAATDEGPDDADAAATVAVSSSDFGDIVVDGEGRTLYMFVPDEGGEPTCTDDCAQAWPVFEGPASTGEGADDTLLSTASHPSGATQVTYGGWPLYYFASDSAPGDVNGQGVNDVWFVLTPDGEPVRDDAAAIGRNVGS